MIPTILYYIQYTLNRFIYSNPIPCIRVKTKWQFIANYTKQKNGIIYPVSYKKVWLFQYIATNGQVNRKKKYIEKK